MIKKKDYLAWLELEFALLLEGEELKKNKKKNFKKAQQNVMLFYFRFLRFVVTTQAETHIAKAMLA